MLKCLCSYLWNCLCTALRGSLASAFNWAGIVGVGILGATLDYRGSKMNFGDGWLGVVISGLVYTGIAWVAIFALRLIFVAPFQVWRKEREKTSDLEMKLLGVADPLTREREEFVNRAFLGLGNAEIEWLERIEVGGRPNGCPDAIWMPLERSGLVDRDHTGSKGIKDELKAAVSRALSARRTLLSALGIIVGVGSKYRKTKTDPHGTTETISIGFRNSHPTRRITNCEFSVRLPESVSAYSYRLQDAFALEANDERLIDVAYFREFNPKTAVPDRIRIPTPPSGTFARQPELPIEPSFITLEANATETKSCKVRCKIWLDEQRHLQLEQAP